jgi:hypothetical protein
MLFATYRAFAQVSPTEVTPTEISPSPVPSTCTYEGGGLVKVSSAEEGPETIEMTDALLAVNGSPCDGMLPGDPMELILVNGTEGSDVVVVNEAGPGGRIWVSPAVPISVRFRIDLGGGLDVLKVQGDGNDEVYEVSNDEICRGLSASLAGVERAEIDAGAGNDTVAGTGCGSIDLASFRLAARSTSPEMTIRGGDGDDHLVGGEGIDWLFGQAGKDYLDGGGDVDRLIGGDGQDLCLYPGDPTPLGCDPAVMAVPPAARVGAEVALMGTGWYPENGPVNISLASATWTLRVAPDGSVGDTRRVPAPPGEYTIRSCQLCSTSDAEIVTTDLTILASGTSAPPASSTPPVGPTQNVGGRGRRPLLIASVALVAVVAGSLLYRRLRAHPVVAGEELTFREYPGDPLVHLEGPVDEGPSIRLIPRQRLDRRRVEVEDGS